MQARLLFDGPTHGLRTPRESFFSKIWNFWAWADILGGKFLRHFGYFWTISTHFSTYCTSVHVFHYSTIISTKLSLYTVKLGNE